MNSTLLMREPNTKEVQVFLTVEELADEIESLRWKSGIEKLKVKETFPKSGTKKFEIKNLTAEVEDGIITFSDDKDTVVKNRSVLMGFLESSVIAVYKMYKSDKTCYKLDFIDGQVLIEEV